MNIFQALDLVFFGVLTRLRQTTVGDYDEKSMNGQITKLIHAYEQTATSFAIRELFEKAELSLNTREKPFRFQFNQAALRENPGFKEIWERNSSAAELSSRRQEHRFQLSTENFSFNKHTSGQF
jgi:hypothetical protein